MADEKKTPVEEETKTQDEKETKEETTPETKVEDVKVEEKAEEVKEEKAEDLEEVKKDDYSGLKPGMTVRVYQRIKEINASGEEKERVQYFEGIIIAKKHNKEIGATITVRKISNGVGVEKIFPLRLPSIEKIEVKKIARVRRAKLFFLRRGFKKKLSEQVIKQVKK